MTIRLSEGLRNRIAQGFGFARSLHNGWIEVYSGTQPVSADALFTGTSLGKITVGSGALTKETRATATLTVTGTAQALTAVTIGTLPIVVDPGRVTTALTDTTANGAIALAGAINTSGICRATYSGAVVTVIAPPGVGAAWNSLALASAGLVCTSSGNMGSVVSGIAAANGLYFAQPAAGVISKPSGVVWSMSGAVAGTAGWFRFYSSDTNDAGSLITTLTEPLHARMDGSCGVGSGDLQLSSLAVAVSGPITVDTAAFTMPAA